MAHTAELDAHGVAVARAACPDRTLCDTLHAEAHACLDVLRAVPPTLAERNRGASHRQFLPVAPLTPGALADPAAVVAAARAAGPPRSKHGFVAPLSPCVARFLRQVLAGAVGQTLRACLGEDAEVMGLLFIRSENGAAAQDVHSDGDWGAHAPRMITVFFAIHDILEEAMGPTHFYPDTHVPRCFAGRRWVPPTPENVAAEKRQDLWFRLAPGDAVMMDSTLWHYGSANTAVERPRTLLSMSFVQPQAGGEAGSTSSSGGDAVLRLCDFRVAESESKT